MRTGDGVVAFYRRAGNGDVAIDTQPFSKAVTVIEIVPPTKSRGLLSLGIPNGDDKRDSEEHNLSETANQSMASWPIEASAGKPAHCGQFPTGRISGSFAVAHRISETAEVRE